MIRALDGNPAAGSDGSGTLRLYTTTGRSIYHSLQARADVRVTDRLAGGVSYTFSKLIDDVPASGAQLVGGIGDPSTLGAAGLQAFAQNPFDTERGERAVSDLDRRHLLMGNFVWSLPFGRGQAGLMGRLLGGWQASGIVALGSGAPYTPLQYTGHGSSSVLFASVFSERLGSLRPFAGNAEAPSDRVAFSNAANAVLHLFTNADGSAFKSPTGYIVADRSGYRAGSPGEARFIYNDYVAEARARELGLAPDAFGETYAAGRTFGDVGRNTLVGSPLYNIDFAIMKTTKLSEKVSLQLRSEFFNLFNHPNRARPNFVLENAGGRGFGDTGEVDSSPRRVRFALKLIF